jgi:predicted kinase
MSPANPRPVAHVIRGLQASGKSTLARRLAVAGAVHVELDEVRRRVWPDCPRSWDPYSGPGLRVQETYEAAVARQLAAGRDVVIDRTNLNPEGLRRLERLGARLVIHDLRHVPLADCIARDAARPAATRVGEAAIRATWDRWLAPGSGGRVKGAGGRRERPGGVEGPPGAAEAPQGG